jgi:ATP synthase I chain
VTAHRDLASRVVVVTGVLTAGLALVCARLGGAADALGAALGSVLCLLNFAALAWAAKRATRGGGRGASGGSLVWIGASGLRLVLTAAVAGLAVAHGAIGVRGLALSLAVVPLAVILAGLRAARVA